MVFTTLKLEVEDRPAFITLNRPERLNAIDAAMPGEIAQAVAAANDDERVHVIVLQGAGKAFCAGYDLKDFAEGDRERRYTQPMPWDPMRDYRPDAGQYRPLFQPVALLQTDPLQGPWLRRGRRLGHRAMRRPAGDGRGCPYRLYAGARLGCPTTAM